MTSQFKLQTLDDVTSNVQYGYTTKASAEGKVKFLRTTDITSGSVNWSTVPYCETAPADIDKYLLDDGDILISRAGSVGYSYLVTMPERSVFASYLIRFKPAINPKYIAYFLKSEEYWAQISEKKLGIAVQNVNASKLKSIKIPVPSDIKQGEIVSKIEELFSELDDSATALATANSLLENLHLSVLNSSTKDDKNGGYAQLDFSSLLTPGRESLKTGPFGTLIGKKDYTEVGVPIIGIENIGELKFINNGFKKHVSPEKYAQLKSYEVKAGDILISRSGTVGEICVVPDGIHGIISTNLIRVRVDSDVIKPEYFIALFKGSSFVLSQVKELCKGSSRLFLNQGIMKQIKYPVPSLNKQEKLLAELDELLSQEGTLSESVHQFLLHTQSLRQSILSKAFKGELI